jgi:DNA-binding XRE family transcriptional regulator/F0F1-type ATP synthase membrane subunit c/vacuolar-type H+-ATPase subunit K
MGFRDNLQHLRATRGMTQEQLAMMVGVSRQSVTKWEAEKAYPEMDKLLKLCQIFDCSLDDLVKGDLTQRPLDIEVPVEAAAEDTIGYVEHHSAFAKRIAFGVASIVAGVGLGLLSAGLMHNVLPDSTVLVTVFVLVFLALGLALIIPAANERTLFMREHPFVIDFFNAEDRAGYGKRTSRQIVCGIALIAKRAYPAALSIVTLLMLVFLAAIISAKVRGLDVSCGCFGGSARPDVFTETLGRDLAITVAVLVLAVQEYRQTWGENASRPPA